MDYILLTFAIVLVFLLYFVFNLLKKLEKYEDAIENYEKIILRNEDFNRKQQEYVLKVSEIIVNTREIIEKVDGRGVFESDDEIGDFFRFLKETQLILNNFIIFEENGKK